MFEKLKQEKELWELFTKKEEYDPALSDRYGRFPYYMSSHRNVFEPEVSGFLVENGLCPEYPEEKKFAVCLTHDIDFIRPRSLSAISRTAKALKDGRFAEGLKIPFSKTKKTWSPFWNFRQIMNLEEKYGSTSTFYFLVLDPGNRDFSFKIEELETELGYISDEGWEVGLHGGHESYNNLGNIKENKRRLEKTLGRKVVGYRNHFLRFKIPESWELLEKAGFKYDSTFGYHDCAGFRNGMCHPFRPFNLKTGKEIAILEIPLTIMDSTLFNGQMHLDFNQAWNLAKRLIHTVEQHRGVLTILWHNTYMQGDYLKFYEKILEHCTEKNAWMSSGEQICEWWDKNVNVR